MSDAIQRVGVVGAGQMGSGIAEVSARAGVEVTVFEPAEALITAGRNRIVKSLERAVSAGKVTERERDRALGLLTFTTDLNDLSDRQLVIEAVVEDEAVKSEIFAELDRVVTDPDAVLASNTSSIPIMKVAAAASSRNGFLACISSIRSRCCRWSSWCARWSPTKPPPRARRSLPVLCWANRSCVAPTAPDSWSMRSWCRICCRRFGWSRPGLPPSKMSTRPLLRGYRTRWVRCGFPILSA